MNSFRAGANLPFMHADPTRAWPFVGLSSFGINALLALQGRNAIALVNANQAAFDGFTTFARRHGDLLTTTADDCGKVIGDVLAAATFEQKATRQAAGALHICDSTVAGLRELSEIATRANLAAADVWSARVREAFDEFKGLFAEPVRTEGPVNALPVAVSVEPLEEATDPPRVVDAEPAIEHKPTVKAARTPHKKGRTRR